MRIVDVCGFYSLRGGGVRTYIDRKLRAAETFGHEIIAVVPGERESIEQVAPGGHLVTIPCPVFPLDPRYHYFASEPQLHAALDNLAPDMVECGTPWSSAGMVARWQGSARRSLVMHCDALATYPYRWFGGVMDLKTIDRGFEWFWRHLRRLGSAYDIVVCANQTLAERLAAGGVPNIAFEPMGVEPGYFDPALRDMDLRASMLEACQLGLDATLLLGVGRHAPEKRWPMIVEAVTAAGYTHDIGLLLAGEGRDRPRIERAIGGNPHIRFFPPTRDRLAFARLMASCDALVHGSESESFGMVAVEARASGIPVIVPDRGGTTDQAAGGMGWTYPAANGAALTETLKDAAGPELEACRLRTAAAAYDMRTMDQHFAELFARYDALTGLRQAA